MHKLRFALILFLFVLAGASFWLAGSVDKIAASLPAPMLGIHTPPPAASPESDSAVCPVYPLDQGTGGVQIQVLSAFEGYSDTLYQPSERSGPTIGFGLDLANAAPGSIRYVLRGLVTHREMQELLTAQGVTGAAARRWIAEHKHVRLDPCTKPLIESRQYAHYWQYALQQDPGLAGAPDLVKTAVTSFVMHTGNLDPLRPALDSGNWAMLADTLRAQVWSGPESTAFSIRRAQEASLIELRQPRVVVYRD